LKKRIIPPTDNLTTGAELRGGAVTDGYQAFKKFRDEIYRAYFDHELGQPSKYEMRMMVWENNDYYVVHPISFNFSQSVSNPLMYRFSGRFIVKQDLTSKQAKQTLSMMAKTDPVSVALTDAKLRSLYFETEATRIAVRTIWQSCCLDNPTVDVARSRAEAKVQIYMPDVGVANVTGYLDQVQEEYRVWREMNNTPLGGSFDSNTAGGVLTRALNRALTAKEQASMKGNTLEGQIEGLTDKVNTLRTNVRDYNRGLADNFNTSTSELRTTLIDVQKLENGIYLLPRDLLPFPLIRELRNMTCLIRSVISFPELMKQSTDSAITDFRNAIRNSGCAQTLIPR
jgi:hypothetical protein